MQTKDIFFPKTFIIENAFHIECALRNKLKVLYKSSFLLETVGEYCYNNRVAVPFALYKKVEFLGSGDQHQFCLHDSDIKGFTDFDAVISILAAQIVYKLGGPLKIDFLKDHYHVDISFVDECCVILISEHDRPIEKGFCED